MTAKVPKRWVQMGADALPGGENYMPNALVNALTSICVLTPVLDDLIAQVNECSTVGEVLHILRTGGEQ